MSGKVGRPKKGEVVQRDYAWDNTRTRISHLVRRNGIEKKCVICGKPGNIMHNKENPYMIAFICNECKNDPEKDAMAEKLRFDIRDKVARPGTHILTYSSDEYVTRIIENYLQDILPIREYCHKVGISNKQFHTLLDKYKEMYPDQPIEDFIKSHRNRVHRHRIRENRSIDV